MFEQQNGVWMSAIPFPPLVVLRIICGFFFIPHAIGKFTAQSAAFGFFHAAGFRPAPVFAYVAMGLELVLGTLLIGGWWVRPAAAIAAVYLLIAAAAVIKVERKWLWHISGCEYAVFWALCCAIVAASA
jgi:putative oxidoreductase